MRPIVDMTQPRALVTPNLDDNDGRSGNPVYLGVHRGPTMQRPAKEITAEMAEFTPLGTNPNDIYIRRSDQVPWIPVIDRVSAKPIRFCRESAGWVSLVRIEAGGSVPLHRHTGAVQGFVLAGSCRYSGSDQVLTAGTYVHEPDGSVDEILAVGADGAEVLFLVDGPRVEYVDEQGAVVHVDDQASKRTSYRISCEQAGIEPEDLEH